MNPLIIFGTGDFADIIYNYATRVLKKKVIGFAISKRFKTSDTFLKLPVYTFENIEEIMSPSTVDFTIGFIGKEMFNQRKKIYNEIKQKGYNIPNIILPSANIYTNNIGDANIILNNVTVEGHCKIGNCNILWDNVVLPHHNQIGNFCNLSPSSSLSGYSAIKDNCFIGNNSTIKNKVCIESYCLVGANAYISKNTSPYSVIVPERSVLLNKNSLEFY